MGDASTAVRGRTDRVKVHSGRPLLLRCKVDEVVVTIHAMELHSLQPGTVF